MLCDNVKCTGCTACFNACASHAISMMPDDEGFLRPHIVQDRCIGCGMCEKVCPQLVKSEYASDFEKKVYACWHKKRKILRQSTSGGAFTALAENVIRDGGVVYGAGFDRNFKVIHKRVANIEELTELRGSKYVQSEIGEVFQIVKNDLKDGRKVLFSGTPCQIDGLYRFLGKRYDGDLYTIDLVCHGVPSPLVFGKYLDWISSKYNSTPKSIKFRNKKPGWYVFSMEIVYKSGNVYCMDTYHDPFIRGFLRQYFLRPSCHQCQYTNTRRPADITLADDWGYKETGYWDRDNDQGISMVMVNNINGKNLFDLANRYLHAFPRTLESAVKGNQALRIPFEPNENREAFWNDFKNESFEVVLNKYLYEEDIPEWTIERRRQILFNRKKRLNKNIIKIKKKIRNKIATMVKCIVSERIIEKIKKMF